MSGPLIPKFVRQETSRFFEGKPCALGHTLRYYCNGACVICEREKSKRRMRERRA